MKKIMKEYCIEMLCILALMLVLSACSNQERTAAQTTTTTVAQSTQPSGGAVVDAGSTSTKEIHIDMFNFGFRQDPTVIHKGDHVRLRITTSEGTHGIMIPGLGLSTGRIAAGGEEVLEFDAKNAGIFEYFCNVPCGPGHRSMRANLTIEP